MIWIKKILQIMRDVYYLICFSNALITKSLYLILISEFDVDCGEWCAINMKIEMQNIDKII